MLRSFISGQPQRYYEAEKGDNPPQADPPTVPEPAKTEKTFTQFELDAIVKDRLEREKRKSTEAAEKARKEAEEKALQEQGEFKTLAEQRAAELATLKSELESAKVHESTAEKYRAALKARLDADKKSLPAHIVALLDQLDEIKQMEWLSDPKNADALKPSSTPDRNLGTPPRNANGGRNTNAPVRPVVTGDDDRPRFTLG